MIGLSKQRVLWRFLALGILTLCLSILSRSTVNTPLLNTNAMIPSPLQTESPRVTAPAQPVLLWLFCRQGSSHGTDNILRSH
jgi:hypothetical protein